MKFTYFLQKFPPEAQLNHELYIFQKQIKNNFKNNPINSIMIFWYFGENQKNAFLDWGVSGHFGW